MAVSTNCQTGSCCAATSTSSFDSGYITVDPADRRIVVSGRIREEFENGKEYYKLHGNPIHLPPDPSLIPATANLEFHAYSVFR